MNHSIRIGLCVLLALVIGRVAAHDIEAWNSPIPEQPEHVLIRSATIWTSTDAGILENADILIRRGSILRIGQGLSAPRGAIEIDAEGRHVTPGLIDAHSHAAMLGGVNEATLISTAMVDVTDIIDAESINIYRQLGGGLTTMHLMHGSANAIGGRNATVKLRWGADPKDMLIEDARPTIKFALGENPKQSNWQPGALRYPQTRHGVVQVIDEKFQQAREYQRRHAAHTGRAARNRVPPRPDIEMDVLVGILESEIDVHSHGYRADEFVALMRVAENHGFRIRAFHHVLEGYKVADELVAHGAGGSAFSDWWAFKYEARDAIPYNAALMHERGVEVSLNSDNSELARRMNLEAAKAVRYGGVSEHDALKMVTINAASHLGIDHRTGSLREGLDADLVIWNGHPLSVYSRADQTWVDGRLYFDRERDLEQRAAWESERQELLALASADDDEDEEDNNDEAEDNDSDDEPGKELLRKFLGGA